MPFGKSLIEVDAQPGGIRGHEGVAVLPSDLFWEQVRAEAARPAGHLLYAHVGGGHAQVDAGRRADWSQRVVRHDVYVMRLRPVRDFERFRKAAHDAEVDAGVADELLL